MRSKFSIFALASAALAVAALSTVPAMASTSQSLKVPFNFIVDGKNLPAGEYMVTRDGDHDFVKLQSRDSSYSFVWVGSPSTSRIDKVILKFEPQGELHVLESVQSGGLVASKINHKSRKAEDVSPQQAPGQ